MCVCLCGIGLGPFETTANLLCVDSLCRDGGCCLSGLSLSLVEIFIEPAFGQRQNLSFVLDVMETERD